jgi:hypothetical protein
VKGRHLGSTCEHEETTCASRSFGSDGWTGYPDFVAAMDRDEHVSPESLSPFLVYFFFFPCEKENSTLSTLLRTIEVVFSAQVARLDQPQLELLFDWKSVVILISAIM